MWLQLVLVLVSLLTLLFFKVQRKFSYFERHGLPSCPGYFPFGSSSVWKLIRGKIGFSNIADDAYWGFPNAKAVGIYGVLGTPSLVIRDIEIAKHIMIKDFDHFVDRREFILSRKANRYTVDMLSLLKGDKWKTIRNIMSPVFTSGKIKSMIPLVNKAGDSFVEYLDQLACQDKEFEGKETMSKYTMDVIATTAFGINVNPFKDPNSVFSQMATKFIKLEASDSWRARITGFFLVFIFPTLGKLFNVPLFAPDAVSFLANVMKDTIVQRKLQNVRKNDFVDLVLDVLDETRRVNKSEMEMEENDKFENDAKLKNVKQKKNTFTNEEMDEIMISNALIIFFAGYDTSSSMMSIVLYYMAKNQDIQEKLHEEIMDAIEANSDDQHLDYNVVQSLPYLDMAIMETLRIYPLISLERLCTKDYVIPELNNFTVPKGMLVQIATSCMMKDEAHFAHPETFNPENFSAEAKQTRNPYAFMAFGHGPRNCIGMRFALVVLKIATVRLLANYKVVPCAKTVDKLIPDPSSQSNMPLGRVWVKVQKRD